MSKDFEMIDTHVNIGAGEIQDDPIMSKVNHDAILADMKSSGISRSVVFSVYCPGGYSKANNEVLEIASRHPKAFIPFFRIKSSYISPNSRKRQLLKALGMEKVLVPKTGLTTREEIKENLVKFRGVKIHPITDGLPETDVLREIEKKNAIVIFHGGESVDFDYLSRAVFSKYKFPCVIAHFGGYPLNRRLYDQGIELARKYDNVFLNTACVFFQPYLEKAVKTVPGKIVFGSDAPAVNQKTAIDCISNLRVPDKNKALVFSENFAKLLGE